MFDYTTNSGIDFSKVLTRVCDNIYGDECAFKQPHKYRFPGGFSFIDSDFVLNDFYIEKVIYNNPATIVFWSDGTKTVSKIHSYDVYSEEVGLILCVLKKLHGNTNVHDLLDLWTPKHSGEKVVSISDVRRRSNGK